MKHFDHEPLESRRLFNFAPFGQPGSVAVSGYVGSTDVAASRNGSYLVATSAQLADASQISATRYNINGQRIGSGPLTLYTSPNGTTTVGQVSATTDDDGDSVISFVTRDGDSTHKLYFVRLSKTGVASTPVLVDTLTVPDPDDLGQLAHPSVSMGSNGSFILGWTADITENSNEARFRAYDASGAPRGAMFAVNELNQNFTGAGAMMLDAAPDGNSAVFAYVYGGTDLNISKVFFGRINTGGLIGTIHEVSNPGSAITDYVQPSIASYADGSFVLSYDRRTTTNSSDSGFGELFIERYNASFVRQGSAIALGASLGEFNSDNAIETLPDGGFAVTYSMTRDDTFTLYAQRFGASGNSDSAGPVDLAATSKLENGDYRNLDIAADGYGTTIVGFDQTQGPISATNVAGFRRLTTQLAIVEGNALYVPGTRRSDAITISRASSGTIIVRNAISGDDGGEKRFGGTGINSISLDAYNGNDAIENRTDISFIARGGSGNDTIYSGGGQDILRGNTGNDVIRAGASNDRIIGDDGADSLFGGDGPDSIEGGDGNDQLRGENGMDILRGGDGDDQLQGGDFNDTLYGDAGSDRLYGDNNNDYLDGGAGRDFVRGGSGDDNILARDNTIDNLFGDGGRDTVTADKFDVLDEIEVVR